MQVLLALFGGSRVEALAAQSGRPAVQVQAGSAHAEAGVARSMDRPGEQTLSVGRLFGVAQPEGAQTPVRHLSLPEIEQGPWEALVTGHLRGR